ncbi:Serine/threonine-protein kinase pelle [Diplonema papillatum]|nr:Serine/threonine-protein kinase pelle [Diplonema papillatum]
MHFHDRRVEFKLATGRLNSAELKEKRFNSRYRLGVSVISEGQGRRSLWAPAANRFWLIHAANGYASSAVEQVSTDESHNVSPGGNVDAAIESICIRRPRIEFSPDGGTLLGKGAFGAVYRGTWDGQKVAVKVQEWKNDEKQRREVVLGHSLVHPNLARVHGWCRDEDNLLVVMPLYSDGSLGKKLKANCGGRPQPLHGGPLGWNIFFTYTLGILRGLRHMADRSPPVLHRDLKPDNILLDGDVVKITDFGLAREALSVQENYTACGTPVYMSPEQFSGEQLTSKTDIYSFGIIAWEMLCTPNSPREVSGIQQLCQEVQAGKAPPMQLVPTDIAEQLLPCYKLDPRDRPAAHALILEFEPLQTKRAAGQPNVP